MSPVAWVFQCQIPLSSMMGRANSQVPTPSWMAVATTMVPLGLRAWGGAGAVSVGTSSMSVMSTRWPTWSPMLRTPGCSHLVELISRGMGSTLEDPGDVHLAQDRGARIQGGTVEVGGGVRRGGCDRSDVGRDSPG